MKFEVLAPASLAETVDILHNDPQVRIIGGGTDLLVRIKQGLFKPRKLISLHKLDILKKLTYIPGQGLHIGALVTHAQAAADPIVNEKFGALAMACAAVGSPQIRNLGTIAGNLANASPAADTAPALLALKAQVIIQGPDGERSIALESFFQGPGKTVLADRELITEIIVPEPTAGTVSTYLKLGRRKALEVAICGVALAARSKAGIWEEVNLALGAVAPTPVLILKAGAVLTGKSWSAAVVDWAARTAAAGSSPIDDQRASAEYRRSMVEVLVRRAANQLELRKEVGINA